MPLPTFQDCMLPTLRILSDGNTHRRSEVVDGVADFMRLSEEDRQQMMPSGKAPLIRSRVGWALTYMKQAGLLSLPQRGTYRITPRGQELLKTDPMRVDVDVLEQYPEFLEFKVRSRPTRGKEIEGTEEIPVARDETTPEEALERAHLQIRNSLEAELLDQVRAASPAFFEQLVVDLLLRMGYGGNREEAGQVLGGTGDGGVDGIIKEDRLGLDLIYVQAKRWTGSVGRPEVQKFAGALQGHRSKKGVFLTTGTFTRDAEEYAAHIDSRIVLVDGDRLVSLMYENNIGVSVRREYEVKQVDSDYFGEE
jgi:restriction system protein